ncbi:hypothetical protein GGI21_005621, partial [Coemansia aciculifera]
VQKVLAEITDGAMGMAVPAGKLEEVVGVEPSAVEDASEDELDLEDMRARLSALRS